MRTLYAVSKSAHVKEPAVICESMADAVVLAEQFNYIGEDDSPEDFIAEVPLIECESDEAMDEFVQVLGSILKFG